MSLEWYFTKNLALKRMPRTISNPRIMLVTFPVEYHNSEMQLMSLDPMIAQGKEYIHNLVMRIVSHKPSVLVIGNTVSGMASRLPPRIRCRDIVQRQTICHRSIVTMLRSGYYILNRQIVIESRTRDLWAVLGSYERPRSHSWPQEDSGLFEWLSRRTRLYCCPTRCQYADTQSD